jgi:hypothetical protein
MKGKTDVEGWDKKTEEALTLIGLTVDCSQYGYICDATDGPAAWKALAEIYKKNSRATRISLKRQFYGYTHDDSLSTDRSIHLGNYGSCRATQGDQYHAYG